jgi:hypothetical protein
MTAERSSRAPRPLAVIPSEARNLFPVYQRVNGIQLTSDYNLLGGVQARF